MVDGAVVQRCLHALGTGSSAGFEKAGVEGCSKNTKAGTVCRLLVGSVFAGLDLIPTGK